MRVHTQFEPYVAPQPDADDEPESWTAQALCAETDPEMFFPEKGKSTKSAKMICSLCTVRAECLESSLVNDERFGVWGGKSERERRLLRRALRDRQVDLYLAASNVDLTDDEPLTDDELDNYDDDAAEVAA